MKAFHKLRGAPETRRFSGEYADDGKAKRLKVREEAGHRCIRCGHPFESGKHGRGEWSPCDVKCRHGGPFRTNGRLDSAIALNIRSILEIGGTVESQWRILTVHHLDGNKANDEWANTLALCQRCHLEIQGKVDPRVPWFLEHSTWFKPYAAAWYAKKYEGKIITREEAEERMEELLAYELYGGTLKG